ncbi:hypothetical protein JCM10212_006722, partial [Sporobolomyces blumeae]
LRIGAIPDIWCSSIERVTQTTPISASRIWYPPTLTARSSATESPGRRVVRGGLPHGMEFRPATEADVPVILSTSEVPHPPAYLSTRLAHTSCIFLTSSSPSSSSTSRSLPREGEVAIPNGLVAHCTTHRDGSIGTLHVSPAHRRKGLARSVLLHRVEDHSSNGSSRSTSTSDPSSSSTTTSNRATRSTEPEPEITGYCYVHRENDKSRAVMKSLGWIETEWNVSWAIVQVDKL